MWIYGDTTRECRCTAVIIHAISQGERPLLDRIDLRRLELWRHTVGTSSAEIRARVEAARQVQRDRGF
jgi:predicted ATPase with chaperone activity